MSFVAKHILAQNERLIGVARLHGIHVLMGVIWMGVVIAAGHGLVYLMAFAGLPAGLPPVRVFDYTFTLDPHMIKITFGGVGACLFLAYFTSYISTEVALTNERVVHKSGLIAVEVQEIDLDEIEAAAIDHGILGALLGYGRIKLDCRFVGDIALPAIRKPYRFLNALHKIQDQEYAHRSKRKNTSDDIPDVLK